MFVNFIVTPAYFIAFSALTDPVICGLCWTDLPPTKYPAGVSSLPLHPHVIHEVVDRPHVRGLVNVLHIGRPADPAVAAEASHFGICWGVAGRDEHGVPEHVVVEAEHVEPDLWGSEKTYLEYTNAFSLSLNTGDRLFRTRFLA